MLGLNGQPMQQIADWLKKLGMSEYTQRFAENGVDFSVLPHLTDQDLKDIGVLLGHRRKILAAIAEMTGAAAAMPAPTAATEPKPQDTAERRQVTVMFSDLVGSTALSARMDPEDLREVISVYQKCVAETVQRFGGFVAKYMGDGVLVYFGYPQAHEHDAERAVRAGLELVSAVAALETHAPLQTRVGIATGLVVVGDLIGSGEAQERGIVGETPNLAARLQSLAEPNAVVIAESTRKLVGNLFELENLGAQDLKGISGPVQTWAAVRPSSVESRFDALHSTGLSELVGREEELELLLRRWSKAKTGQGQVILLSGEPGIGKSRLTAALLEHIAAEAHTRLRYFCSPQRSDSPLFPINSQMERAARFTHADDGQVKLNKLDAVLALTSTSKQDAALFAEMLSLLNDGRYPAIELTPQQRRQKTLEALTAQVEALSRANPVLMIFEDVHWIDPTSLEALGRTVDRLRTLGVLLIATYRPEFEPPWIGRPYVTALNLNRLGEREISALIMGVTGNMSLPESVKQDIIERTDGIPLFVEEMTKAVLEAESESEARKTTAAVPSSSVAVPASLHASLMARLDRLGSAKEVAQIGAVIGREFSHGLLAAVVSEPEIDLVSTLERLTAADLLLRQGVPPHATYLFKHALIQDAAYGTLLRGPRRALHARIADTLESQFADIAETQPELVARHCTEAGLIEKAAGLWGKAGQRSIGRSALVEAAEQLTRALAQIKILPATPVLRRETIKLQVALATVLFHVKGYTAPETIAAFEHADAMIEQAEALGERSDDDLLRFSVLYGQWTGNHSATNLVRALEVAKHFLVVAETQPLSAPLLMAHRVMGATLCLLGQFTTARQHLDRAVMLYSPKEHQSLATRFGQDIGVAALGYRAATLGRMGYPESALRDIEEALNTARALGQTGTLLYALMNACMSELLCRFATADAHVEQLIALTEKCGLSYWKPVAQLMRGWLFAATHRSDEAVKLICSSLSELANTRTTMFAQTSLVCLAHAYASCGRVAEAETAISHALATNEKWDAAEIHRTAGELAVALLHYDQAELHFRQSLDVANRQGARLYELRVARSLARLRRKQGRLDEAREVLAPIIGWFTEGFDLPDLIEANALLQELG
jgi:class 3 adenylate cyclase/tetratricopeptide (TPR) repeat protein